MNLSFTQEIYSQMKVNAQKGSQKIQNESLIKLNTDNLNLKSLCSRTFDCVIMPFLFQNLLHATFMITAGIQSCLEIVDKVNQILQYFKLQWQSGPEDIDKNPQVLQLIAEQSANP